MNDITDESRRLQLPQVTDQPLSRRRHREWVERRNRRLRRRRKRRIRRVRFWRTVRTARFWVRVLCSLVLFLACLFWSKFAFVYAIPSYAAQGSLKNVIAYVTVKPWWFGPPVFNLKSYVDDKNALNVALVNDPYNYLLLRLGRYDAVVTSPQFIWIRRR